MMRRQGGKVYNGIPNALGIRSMFDLVLRCYCFALWSFHTCYFVFLLKARIQIGTTHLISTLGSSVVLRGLLIFPLFCFDFFFVWV